MVGALLRCRITYDAPSVDAPESVIIKLPSADDNTRGTARQLGLYQREFEFYRFLAPAVPLRSPSLLYGDFDDRTHNFVLILEDLGGMESADQVKGANEQQAKAAIRAAARLHGQFWGRAHQPPVSDVYAPSTPERHAMVQSVYQASLSRALDIFSDQFSAPMRRLAEAYGSHLAEHSAMIARGPQTLIHGDYRLDNMFFDSASDFQVALVDWQVSGVSSGLYDVAYFLSSSVSTDVRRTIERSAIRQYHELVAGMTTGDLTFEDCWRGYRENLLGCFRVPIIAGAQLDFNNDRGRQLAQVFLQRTLAAINDLDAGKFLPDPK